MPSRAIDFHVHLPTPDWLDGSMAGYVEAAEAYFRSPVSRQSLGELAALYRGLEVTAVLLALFHTGTSGIGARQPGGQGIRIDLAHPIKLDPVAAAHPALTVVAAHFGWPWHLDLIAIALHKTNVYIDISGWAPRRIPAEVIRELRGRLSGQFLWGSDYPFIAPERCLSELEGLDIPADTMRAVLHDNAARVLGLNPGPLLLARGRT